MINPATPWVNITGNLFSLLHIPFGDPNLSQTQLAYLTSIAADWRYVIPDNFAKPPANPTDEFNTHPILYVGGEGGVYRSIDDGKTWALFPSVNAPTASDDTSTLTNDPFGNGGGLPDAHVTDLDMSLGNIDPTTGRAVQQPGDPNVLLASTYGRGAYAIRLAPSVFDASLGLDPNLQGNLTPPPQTVGPGSDSGRSATDQITNVWNSVIDGFSEQSAFGNTVHITLVDETDPTHPVYIGGYDGAVVNGVPLVPGGSLSDATATNTQYQTDSSGRFDVPITVRMPDGVRTIGVIATDSSGTQGNVANFTFTLLTATPATPGIALDPASDSGRFNNDDYTNVTQPTFDISNVQPNAQVFLYRDGTLIASPIFAAGGNVTITDTFTTPALSDGNHTYTVYQQDIAGNNSATSSPLTITIDTQVAQPTNLTLDPASDAGKPGDNLTNVTDPTFDVSNIENNAQLTLYRDGVPIAGLAPIYATGGTVTITDPGIPAPTDGVHSYQVVQTDLAGNVSAASPPLTITVDTVIPNAPNQLVLDKSTDSGVQGDNLTNVTSPTFDVTGLVPNANFPKEKLYELLLFRDGGTTPVATETFTTPPTGPVTITDPGTTPGRHSYTVEQVTTAGNASAASAAPTITIDVTPPNAPGGPVLDPASDSETGTKTGTATNVTNPTFDILSGLVPNATFPAKNLYQVLLFRDGTQVATETFNTPPTGLVTITDPGITPLPTNKNYTYTVEQVDAAGNVSTMSAGLTILVDNVPPAGPASLALDPSTNSGGTSSSPYYTNSTHPKFDISGTTAGLAVLLLRNNVVVATLPGSSNTGGTVTLTDTSVPAIPPAGTQFTYTAEQQDYLSNTSLPVAATTNLVTIKTQVKTPGHPILDPASDSGVKLDNLTSVTNPTFDLTSNIEPNTRVVLFRDGSPVATVTVGATVPATVTITDPGTTPALSGAHTYTVKQTDLANNVSSASPPLTITIDTAPPNAPNQLALDAASDSGKPGDNLTNVTTPTFDVTGLVPNTTFPNKLPYKVLLFRDGGATPVNTVTFTSPPSGTVTITDPGTTPGQHTYTVEQVDTANNVSAASNPLTVTIDTTIPNAPNAADTRPGERRRQAGRQPDQRHHPDLHRDRPRAEPELPERAGVPGAALPGRRRDAGQHGHVHQPAERHGDDHRPGHHPGVSGQHAYTVKQVTVAGNISAASTPQTITIDTTIPNAPNQLVLDPASDSGVKLDNLTKVTNPTFDVTGLVPNTNFPKESLYQLEPVPGRRRDAGQHGHVHQPAERPGDDHRPGHHPRPAQLHGRAGDDGGERQHGQQPADHHHRHRNTERARAPGPRPGQRQRRQAR